MEEAAHLHKTENGCIMTGSLNAHTVFIVPKNRLANDRSNPSATRFGNKMKTLQPFEPTFRLQVQKIPPYLIRAL